MMRSVFVIAASLAIFLPPLHAEDAKSDEVRDREIRSLEKQVAKLEKQYDKLLKRCQGDERNFPDARACDTARVTYQDIQQLKKQLVTLTKD